MSYRATMDASHKVTRKGGHHQKFVRHIARDVDRAAGVVHPMANENIDWSRTQHNRTMVADGNGGFRPAKSSAEIINALEERMTCVKDQQMPNGSRRSGLKSNSVVMRPLVLSLPQEWYDEHSSGWEQGDFSPEAERLHALMESWAITEFGGWSGNENIPGYSWHMDETLPAQLQFLFTPVTADGRMSQTDFFTNPTQLKMLGARFRQHLKDNGFDIELKPSKRSKEHLDNDEFQQRADRLRVDQDKLDATLAAATRDGDKLWQERKQVSAAQADLDADRARLDAEIAEVPKVHAKAKSDGYTEGRDLADRDTADVRVAAQQAERDAQDAKAIALAESNRLRALREEVERDLAEAGPAPELPSYDDIRKGILSEQSFQMTKYLKGLKRKDGTTMFDAFELYARAEHTLLKGRGDPVPRFEMWRDRTVAAQSKLLRAKHSAPDMNASRRNQGRGLGE